MFDLALAYEYEHPRRLWNPEKLLQVHLWNNWNTVFVLMGLICWNKSKSLK